MKAWIAKDNVNIDEIKDSSEFEICKFIKLRPLEYIEEESSHIRKNDKLYNET